MPMILTKRRKENVKIDYIDKPGSLSHSQCEKADTHLLPSQ